MKKWLGQWRFRGSRYWALLLLAPLLLGAALDVWLSALNEAAPYGLLRPLPSFPSPSVTPARQLPQSVVLIVIDGLRLDESRRLPFLNELRSRGVAAEARAQIPTHSRPNYFALLTGTSPERHGVRNNRFREAAVADTLLARVRAQGGRVAAASDLLWWFENFGADFDHWQLAERDELDTLETSFQRALSARARLTLLHVVAVDTTAHLAGIGPAYREVASRVDALLARVCAGLDIASTLLVVTADHGHRARGGHGGAEAEVVRVPLIFAGPGVRRGYAASDLGSLAGLAPTLALLSGVAFPADASSPVYDAILDRAYLGTEYVSGRLDEYLGRRTFYETAWLKRADAALPVSRELTGLLRERAAVTSQHQTRRVWLTRVLACFWLSALVWLTWRFTPERRSWLGIPVFGLVAGVWVLIFSGTVSASAVARSSSYLLLLTLGASAGLALHAVSARWLVRREPAARAWQRALCRDAVIYASLTPLLWLTLGFTYPGQLPDPLFLYLPLPTTFAGSFLAACVGLWCVCGRPRPGQ